MPLTLKLHLKTEKKCMLWPIKQMHRYDLSKYLHLEYIWNKKRAIKNQRCSWNNIKHNAFTYMLIQQSSTCSNLRWITSLVTTIRLSNKVKHTHSELLTFCSPAKCSSSSCYCILTSWCQIQSGKQIKQQCICFCFVETITKWPPHLWFG